MNLSQIIERKKEEFDKGFSKCIVEFGDVYEITLNDELKDFLEKAIRESVEEALREVRPDSYYLTHSEKFDNRVKEFMK